MLHLGLGAEQSSYKEINAARMQKLSKPHGDKKTNTTEAQRKENPSRKPSLCMHQITDKTLERSQPFMTHVRKPLGFVGKGVHYEIVLCTVL